MSGKSEGLLRVHPPTHLTHNRMRCQYQEAAVKMDSHVSFVMSAFDSMDLCYFHTVPYKGEIYESNGFLLQCRFDSKEIPEPRVRVFQAHWAGSPVGPDPKQAATPVPKEPRAVQGTAEE